MYICFCHDGSRVLSISVEAEFTLRDSSDSCWRVDESQQMVLQLVLHKLGGSTLSVTVGAAALLQTPIDVHQ